jgi:hypothetical protein
VTSTQSIRADAIALQVAMEQHHVAVLKRELESRSAEVTNLHHKLRDLASKSNLTEFDVKALLGGLMIMLLCATLLVGGYASMAHHTSLSPFRHLDEMPCKGMRCESVGGHVFTTEWWFLQTQTPFESMRKQKRLRIFALTTSEVRMIIG